MALLAGLHKTRRSFFERVRDLVTLARPVDDAVLDRLEETFIASDMGVDLSLELIGRLKERARAERLRTTDQLMAAVREELKGLLMHCRPRDFFAGNRTPVVFLVVGVNGAGKTTTLGKLAAFFIRQGKRPILAACDTFRAAAIEQVAIWAERSGTPLIRQAPGADPASVAFDALNASRARGADCLLIDTAGRLHTKVNLMNELKKLRSVLLKQEPGLRLFTLLVLDGTNGQNALAQAREFNAAVDVDGLIVTKLDGTAKGGALFSICRELKVPVDFIGTGEALEDIEPFDAGRFIDAFFKTEE
ncbi:MAG: signal recognition particle-docking protein FtsY [Fibrobacterota bacterium]